MNEYDAWKAEQAAAWLDHVRGLSHDIARLRDNIDVLQSLALPRGVDYARPVVSASPSPDAIPNAVARLQDSIDDYNATLALYAAEEYDAQVRLSSIGDWRYRDVIIRHYLLGQKWAKVGDDMGYSADYCRELRTAALPHVYGVMPLEWRVRVPRAD